MFRTKFFFHLGLLFLTFTIIGISLIIYGTFLMSAFEEPLPIALNSLLIGIILFPVGAVFMSAFFYQGYSYRKKKSPPNA